MSAWPRKLKSAAELRALRLAGEPGNEETRGDAPSGEVQLPTAAQLLSVHHTNGRNLDGWTRDDGTIPEPRLRDLDFFTSSRCAENTHVVPRDEETDMQLCMYLRAVGELPGIDTVKEANKTVSLDNMVVTSCKWIVYMHTVQNLFFVPLDMPVYVETLEESLTAIHAEACDEEPSSWHWSARQAMALNDASDEPTLRFYRYRIVVLPRTKRAGEDVDRGFYDSFARMRTNVTGAEEDLDVVHKLIAARSDRWPLEYDPPLPIVQLPLSPIKAAAAFIMTIAADDAYSKLSPELQEWHNEADYFLRLVETNSPSSWRKFDDRPASLRPLQPSPVGSCLLRRVYQDMERWKPQATGSDRPSTSSELTKDRSAVEKLHRDVADRDAHEKSKSDVPSLVPDKLDVGDAEDESDVEEEYDDEWTTTPYWTDTPELDTDSIVESPPREAGLDIPILYGLVTEAELAAFEAVRHAILDKVEADVGRSDDDAATLRMLRSRPECAVVAKKLRKLRFARKVRLGAEAEYRIQLENEVAWAIHYDA